MDIHEFYENNRCVVEDLLSKRVKIEELYTDGNVSDRHIESVKHNIIYELYLEYITTIFGKSF